MTEGQYAGGTLQQETNVKALLSLIFAIMFFVIGFIGSIVAVILGNIAQKEIAAGNGTGGEMARWGVILGWCGIIFSIIMLLLFMFVFLFMAGMMGGF